jgi:hypothetical protein
VTAVLWLTATVPFVVAGYRVADWLTKGSQDPQERARAIRGLIAGNFRFVVIGKILPGYCEAYKGDNCPAYRLGSVPIAGDMLTVLDGLKPVRESHIAAVFDGRAVAEAFQRLREP